MNPLRYFDPLKWIDDLLCTLHNGGGVRLEWLGGLDGADAERMLRAHGVKVWGRLYAFEDGDRYGLTVRKAQAKWAAGLLAGHGCAVLVGPKAKPVRPRYNWGAPAPAQGFGGAVVEMLGGAPATGRPRRERRTRNRRGTRNARR
jgi:hypothetical protein